MIAPNMKHLIVTLLLAAGLAAAAQNTSFTATVKGLPEGVRVVVSEAQNGRLVPADTLTPDAKGRIRLALATADPRFFGLSLTMEQTPMAHLLLLPKEKVSFALEYDPASRTLTVADVQGSDNMALYSRFSQRNLQAMREQDHTFGSYVEQELRAHPDLLMSAFLVTVFEQDFEHYVDLYRLLRDSLMPRYPDHDFVRHLDERVRTAVVVGMEAPDIVMPGVDGHLRRLSDLRGSVVLIDFWASWCRPCRMENPNVVRLYQKYHERGFNIFSVSLDNRRDAWMKAIEDDGLVWPDHVGDLRGWQSAGGRLYGVSSIPATVLLDREGRVLARNLRGQELENKLKEIFEQ